MILVWTAAAIILCLCVVAAMRGTRSRRAAHLRATWGRPIERSRRLEAMAASHRSRLAGGSPARSLDDRTWTDLDLDAVFANAVERIAAGQAVLAQLLEAEGGEAEPHVVLGATHDLELVELASDRYEPYHFGDSVGPDGLVFDHRLQRGPSTSRNAITLLRLHGAPEALISRAMTTAAMIDEQRRVVGIGRGSG